MEQNLYLGCGTGPVLLEDEHAVDLPPHQICIFPYQILSLSFLQGQAGCFGFVFKQYGLTDEKDLFFLCCFLSAEVSECLGRGSQQGIEAAVLGV